MASQIEWTNLIVERGAAPPPISEERFREWMGRQRIFVSSVMDTEMQPARDAVRAWIRTWSGAAEMWEELAPRDQHPERAYLEGVDRSTIYVLLVGSRYGVRDDSGYSPTHKEGNRAEERGIPRLLAEKMDVAPHQRAGEMNDWLRSLYNRVSGARYAAPEDLTFTLEARLREMASQQSATWVKLGQLVFPGRVRQSKGRSGSEIVATGTVRQGAVRRALSQLGHGFSTVRTDRLTWAEHTHPVQVLNAQVETRYNTEDEVSVTCGFPQNYYGSEAGVFPVSYGSGGGPAPQVEVWARYALFGEEPPSDRQGRHDMLYTMSRPTGPTLPDVLRTHGAEGWLAEGLTRLYLVEHLLTQHGGHFERLEVGPATASGVPVHVRFAPGGHSSGIAEISGVVPRA